MKKKIGTWGTTKIGTGNFGGELGRALQVTGNTGIFGGVGLPEDISIKLIVCGIM